MKKYIDKLGDYNNRPNDSKELLNDIFKYKEYSKRNITVEILRRMNVEVCPYCNRQYIFTIGSGKVRPQLDHFYPKSQYPYLALSLYNMIPSCGICNMAKSSLNTVYEPVLYPYDEEFGYSNRFGIKIKDNANYVKVLQGVSSEFTIILSKVEDTNEKVIRNQMEKLHLDELYNQHIDYVMNIIKSRYINTAERINEIYIRFPNIFHSYQEVKTALHTIDTRKEAWGKRPLTKLTYDIERQLEQGEIYIEE